MSERSNLSRRIADNLPVDIDLDNKNAVFTAAIKIDPRMQYASDEMLQEIIEAARRHRVAQHGALDKALDVFGFALLCLGFISVMFVGNAFAADGTTATDPHEYLELVALLVVVIVAVVVIGGAVLNVVLPVKWEDRG